MAATSKSALARHEERWLSHLARWWHAVFVGLCLVVTVILALAGVSPIAYVLLGGMLLSYAAVGRRALIADRTTLGAVYLALAVPLFTGLVYLEPNALLLLFALYPQTFAVIPRLRQAVVAVSLLTLLWGFALVASRGFTPEATLQATIQAALNLAIALLLGMFINAIMAESERRAALLAQLTETREELAASRHREGVLEERERLAREIHDTLAQGFAGILTISQATRRRIGDEDDAVPSRLRLIERTARDNLAEARALVAALSPAGLQDGTLSDALRSMVLRFQEEHAIAGSYRESGPATATSPQAEVVLLRSTQEALTNVWRHANARTVDVHLHHAADGVSVEIRDDGDGFDPATADGYGLTGMRARVDQVGGELDVRSAAGAGTTVRVFLREDAARHQPATAATAYPTN